MQCFVERDACKADRPPIGWQSQYWLDYFQLTVIDKSEKIGVNIPMILTLMFLQECRALMTKHAEKISLESLYQTFCLRNCFRSEKRTRREQAKLEWKQI